MSLVGSRAYRPALDGMRAVSVLTIILFHLPVSWVLGGYWSVNVFFVVSGYLITGLLLGERQRWGRIDLIGFYLRRARRLLPALLLLVVVVALIGPHVLGEQAVARLRPDGLAALFYATNWYLIATGNSYFQQFGDPSPFQHTWTLAIEEQYYLAFPVILIGLFLLARRRRWLLPVVLGVLTLGSAYLMARFHVPGQDASRVYYGTDTRMQDILTGATLAAGLWALPQRSVDRLARRHRMLAAVAVAAAVVGLLAARFVPAVDWTYRGGYLLFDVVFAALILSVELHPGSLVGRGLSWGPLAWTGKVSYGLYLWHWPVIIALNQERAGWAGPLLDPLRIALTFGLAALSFRLVEDPVRRGAIAKRAGRRVGVLVGAAAVPIVAAVLLVGTPAPSSLAVTDAKAGESRSTSSGDGSFSIVIVGDSVGFAIGFGFQGKEYPDARAAAEVTFGCGTTAQYLSVNGRAQKPVEDPQTCEKQFERWTAAVRNNRASIVLWSLGGWEVFDHVIDGRTLTVGSPEYAAYLRERLEKGLAAIGPVPVAIPTVPCYHQPPYVVQGQDMSPVRNDPTRAAAVNRVLGQFAQAHPGQVFLIDQGAFVCPGGKELTHLDGVKLRSDGVHYTTEGAIRYWRWLMPQLRQVARQAKVG